VDKAAMLKSYELTVEYQASIEPLLYKFVQEDVLVGYDFRYSPSNVGCYKKEKEVSAVVVLIGVSRETAEKVAQAICELKDGHKKKEQESVAIAVSDGEVYFYENKNMKRLRELREVADEMTSVLQDALGCLGTKVDSSQLRTHNV